MIRGAIILVISWSTLAIPSYGQKAFRSEALSILKPLALKEAEWAMQQQPVTVTAETSPRSAGTSHDFYSEGDYWWPDSSNVNGPYIQRDGRTNPDNFVAHRLAMIRFSKIIGSLASAYVVTHDERYVRHALAHLNAWFISPQTLMNPDLQYAQAIKGLARGRGIGIIDTIHLMEVAQGVIAMQQSSAFDQKVLTGVKVWFNSYIDWLTSHPYGKDEMNAKNNHGTCWVMQVASFSKLTDRASVLELCRSRFKTVLLPEQMAVDGSFPLELRRTKPYGYSIFNLDAMAMICVIASAKGDDLWQFATPDGKSIRKGIEYLHPFLEEKDRWPFKKDVMYWDQWPVSQPALLFGAIALRQTDWFNTWRRLNHNPLEQEVIRNLPVRHPLIWMTK